MVEEPQALRERPHVGRFPVPVVTAVIDGIPDFKVHDEVARARCGALRLCQLCGKGLGRKIAFVGTEYSIERRTFGEPPAHPDCMAFALDVCPWLSGRPYVVKQAAGISTLPPPAKEPPEMGLLITTGYWLVADDEGLTGFKYRAAEPLKIEWRKRG
jgi:hypothetical protein